MRPHSIVRTPYQPDRACVRADVLFGRSAPMLKTVPVESTGKAALDADGETARETVRHRCHLCGWDDKPCLCTGRVGGLLRVRRAPPDASQGAIPAGRAPRAVIPLAQSRRHPRYLRGGQRADTTRGGLPTPSGAPHGRSSCIGRR